MESEKAEQGEQKQPVVRQARPRKDREPVCPSDTAPAPTHIRKAASLPWQVSTQIVPVVLSHLKGAGQVRMRRWLILCPP